MFLLLKTFRQKINFAVFVLLFLGTLLTFSSALAVFYDINTDDGTVEEWTSQNIATFQTDPVEGIWEPDIDIVNAWMATKVDHNDYAYYFMVQMAGSPAVGNTATPFEAVGAILDCNRDGNVGDLDDDGDRIVFYYGALYDKAGWFAGNPDGAPGEVTDDSTLGEVVGEYVEWSIHTTALKFQNCTGQVDVKFFTATDADGTGVSDFMDQTDSFRTFNVPTAVSMKSVQAISPKLTTSGMATGAILLIAGLLLWRRQRQLLRKS